jgi:peroxiredoxin
MSQTPTPRQAAPELAVETLDNGSWNLTEQNPENFTLVIFYRGLHCPVCKDYLQTLTELESKFGERGVKVMAVSMDSEDRAREAQEEWGFEGFPLGYGLSKEAAADWGLYLSAGISDAEPELFSEPGLFLVRPDGELFYGAINSMPFGRPHLPTMLKSLDFVLENDYPARGEVIDANNQSPIC